MKKYIFSSVGILLLALIGVLNFAGAATVLFPSGGGTGTGSVPSYGQVLIGTSDGKYTPVATSTLGITGSGGSGNPDFTYNTDIGFGVTGSATTTKTKFTAGIHASGTSQIDNSSTTLATIVTGWFTNINVGVDTLLEYIADSAGAMFTGNTETGITVTYQDADNTVDVVCDTASGSVFGCLASADWTTFNGKQATISATYPLVLTGATLSTPLSTTTVKQTYGTNQSGELSLATTSDTNLGLSITNTNGAFTFTPQWIGTLANARLTNSSVSYGGVAVSLGASDATPAFNLADATGLPLTTGITGTLGVANGGTGQASFGQGWLHTDGTTFTSSTSPTVNYLTATSTTAASTFAGNVGIGTTSPMSTLAINSAGATALTIKAASSNTATLDFYRSTANSGRIQVGTSNQMIFSTNNAGNSAITERMRITNTGTVGIGTTSPMATLEVGDSANTQIASLVTNSNGGTAAYAEISARNGYAATDSMRLLAMGTGWTTNGAFVQDAGVLSADSNLSGGLSIVARGASAPMRFYTGGFAGSNERLRISSTGNVGVATTSPWRTFSVDGTMANTGMTAATAGTNRDICISASGDFINESTGTCIVSSRKFKHDIKPLEVNALDFIKNLRTVSFIRNEDPTNDTHYGFIAEEADDVDTHLSAKGSMGEVRSLDEHAFLAVLWKGVQEQQEQIDGITGKAAKSVQDSWQWGIIFLLIIWIIKLEVKLKKHG